MDLCSSSNISLNWNCTSFDDLPDGLIVDILSRLPVKTLVQSTSVSKLWYSLIKSPSFVSTHLSRSISDPSSYYIFLVHKCSPLEFTVVSDNHVLTRHPNLSLPFKTMTETLVIGTCNGLLCLTDCDDVYNKYYGYGRHIYLINPFIHKYKRLAAESSCYPDFIFEIDDNRCRILVSFGYSEADNDYKIFRILIRYLVNDPMEPLIVLKKVEIYSLNAGKWKGMDALVDQVPIHCSPTFVNGCLYWLPNTTDGSLLCFDLKDEVFSKINLPTAYVELCFPWSFRIRDKNGSVALYTTNLDNIISPSKRFCLLVLEKDIDGHAEWKELYYETTESIPSNCMGFSGCGRLIYVNRNWSMKELIIVAADLDDSFAIEKLQIDFTNGFTGAINVMESLVMFSD